MTTYHSEKEALTAMLECIEHCGGNVGILVTSSCPFTDLPRFDSVGPRDNVDVRTAGEVRHVGFGCFEAEAPGGGRLTFDGGPYMNDVRKPNGTYHWAWTDLRANGPETLARAGYLLDQVREDLRIALRDLGGPVCEACDKATHNGATLCQPCAESDLASLEGDYMAGRWTFSEWQREAASVVAQAHLDPRKYLRLYADPCKGCIQEDDCSAEYPSDCRPQYPLYDR